MGLWQKLLDHQCQLNHSGVYLKCKAGDWEWAWLINSLAQEVEKAQGGGRECMYTYVLAGFSELAPGEISRGRYLLSPSPAWLRELSILCDCKQNCTNLPRRWEGTLWIHCMRHLARRRSLSGSWLEKTQEQDGALLQQLRLLNAWVIFKKWDLNAESSMVFKGI